VRIWLTRDEQNRVADFCPGIHDILVYAFRSTPQFGLTVVRLAYPLRACNTAFVAFSAFFPIGTSGSALLWLFRLRAIYGGNRIVTFIFGSLWLALVGASVTLPIAGVITTSLENPPGCLVVRSKKYDGAFGIILTVYDTLVFLAISYRLASIFPKTEQQTQWEQIKALFSGSNLPAFSKTLFTDGQMYYLCVSIVPPCRGCSYFSLLGSR
jgi:hypothetical protein